jgi:CBS domain-containing protein
MKKVLSAAIAIAVLGTGIGLENSKIANAAQGKVADTNLVYGATVSVSQSGDKIEAKLSDSNFTDITKVEKDGTITYPNIAEAGWESSVPKGWSFFISHQDTMNIMKNYEKPVIIITAGDVKDVSVQEQCKWSVLKFDETKKEIDLTSLVADYKALNDVKDKDDWQGLVLNVPTGREISFEIIDAAKPALTFTMQDTGWVEYTKNLSVQGNGDYSINFDSLQNGALVNVGFFKSTDTNMRIKMGTIVVNGKYKMTLAKPGDLNYDAVNPSDATMNGLANIWNKEGQSEIVAESDDAILMGDGGTSIALMVNDKNTDITSLQYNFTLSGLSSNKPSNGNTETVTTVVVPAQVKGVKANNNTKGIVTVTWNKVDNAKGYIVYRATEKDGKYEAIKTINSSSAVKFVNKDAKKGVTYYYKIKAYNMDGSKKVLSKKYSAIVKVKVKK